MHRCTPEPAGLQDLLLLASPFVSTPCPAVPPADGRTPELVVLQQLLQLLHAAIERVHHACHREVACACGRQRGSGARWRQGKHRLLGAGDHATWQLTAEASWRQLAA